MPFVRPTSARSAAVALALVLATVLAGCTNATAVHDTADHRSGTASPLTVATTSGRLHGKATGQVREFLGVRYAEAPTGDRRWTMPVAAPKAAGIVQATRPGPSCAQAGSAPGASATASTSEDCLFLNVTTPRTARPGARLPVMVWWHGGGYTTGSGSAYDAQRLATRGHVVVVTVNYRLGVFGYLSLPGLAGSGDFGLGDQILATRWAKSNAAAFGGNPHNVTVFGESAGGMSACALLGSPAAEGLVDKVAVSSGSCGLDWPKDGLLPGTPAQTPYAPLTAARQLGVGEARTLGCTGSSTLSCLRSTSAERLLKIFPAFSDVLAYDTPLLPHNPATAVATGQVVHVPLLFNTNHDEERAFVGGAQKAKPYFTATTYPTYLRSAFGADAEKVARRYPLADYPNAATAWSTVITDSAWACPTLDADAELTAHGSTVHSSEFDDPNAPDVNMVRTASFEPRAAHATDVPYLFDLLGKDYVRGAGSTRLSNAMIDYWTSFARTGTPSAAGAPSWPAYGSAGRTLRLEPGHVGVENASTGHRCGFWHTLAASS